MARSTVSFGVPLLLLLSILQSVSGLGVNWGTIAVNPLPPSDVVKLLQANGINKVKLFDAEYDVVKSLAGTGIELTVAAPNEMLAKLAVSQAAADAFVKENVTDFRDVNIRWVAVGNEPFLEGYNNTYLNTTLPALLNIVAALAKAGHSDTVRAIIPFNADVLDGAVLPSQTRFKPQYLAQIMPMLEIFNRTGAPFSVNLYPFISKYQDPDFPLDYAFFDGTSSTLADGTVTYTNALDASLDALVSALAAAGYPKMEIVLGEIGWPSDGNQYATLALAGKYNQELIQRLQSRVGTPLRPGAFFEFFLFGLLDENAKSVLPGTFERHWGIFYFDGVAKYPLDLAAGTPNSPQPIKSLDSPPYMSTQYCVLNLQADRTNLSQNIEYACGRSDCTPLSPGASCGALSAEQTASYAFNAYFQLQSQDPHACDFQGLAIVTKEDPSVGTCRFKVGLVKYSPSKPANYYSPSSSSAGRKYSYVGVGALFASLILIIHGLLHL